MRWLEKKKTKKKTAFYLMRPHPISLFHAVPATRNGAYGAKKFWNILIPKSEREFNCVFKFLFQLIIESIFSRYS